MDVKGKSCLFPINSIIGHDSYLPLQIKLNHCFKTRHYTWVLLCFLVAVREQQQISQGKKKCLMKNCGYSKRNTLKSQLLLCLCIWFLAFDRSAFHYPHWFFLRLISSRSVFPKSLYVHSVQRIHQYSWHSILVTYVFNQLINNSQVSLEPT